MNSRQSSTTALSYTQTNQAPSISGFAICLLTLLVFALHGILQFVLYYGRVHKWPLCDSDLVIFGLPNALSLSAYALLMVRWIMPKKLHPVLKIIWMILFLLILQFFSWWASMLIPVNTYGT